MKKTIDLKFTALAYIAVATSAVIFLTGLKQKSFFDDLHAKSGRITKFISSDNLQQVIHEDTISYLVLDVYPLKHSSSLKKNDFDLELVCRKPNGDILYTTYSQDSIGVLSENYFLYLLKSKKSLNAIPYGYQALIPRTSLSEKANLRVSITPLTLTGTFGYDTCKVPPGCEYPEEEIELVYGEEVVPSDSCKYPPGCKLNLLHLNAIKQARLAAAAANKKKKKK